MPREHLRSGDGFVRDDGSKPGRLFVKERGESIEVGERIIRPLQVY